MSTKDEAPKKASRSQLVKLNTGFKLGSTPRIVKMEIIPTALCEGTHVFKFSEIMSAKVLILFCSSFQFL